jgi:hypothetical protein
MVFIDDVALWIRVGWGWPEYKIVETDFEGKGVSLCFWLTMLYKVER